MTRGIDAINHKIEAGEGVCRKLARDLLRDTPDVMRRVGRVCERVVGDVTKASVSSSAFSRASAAISLISSSSVLGTMDLRLRDLARRVDGGGGEAVRLDEEVVLVGVAGWWRVETIVLFAYKRNTALIVYSTCEMPAPCWRRDRTKLSVYESDNEQEQSTMYEHRGKQQQCTGGKEVVGR